MPQIRQFALSQLPVVWKKDGIVAMLKAIDRNTANGKRDYAIFMLAVNLGLRIGDILHLKFQNIDWTKAVIQVSQAKTNELLFLPMSNEIGWALIEYIKEGRPHTDEPFVFIRHCAPFQAFCINNNFHYQIRKYAALAGIQPPSSKLYGMHSLRHTFATNLLKEGSQLPVISELLGHNGASAAPIYLKVDDEQLRLCALDPEIEVNSNE
jgi:site-specific recombinase XerD